MKLMRDSEFKTWLSYLLLICSGIAAYAIINNLSPIFTWLSVQLGHLSPFLAGVVIAYLLDIPCTWIEKQLKSVSLSWVDKHARGLAVVITYACTITLLVVSMRLLIPEIVRSVMEFAYNVPVYFQRAVAYATELTQNENVVNLINALDVNTFFSEFSLKSIMNSVAFGSIWQSIVGLLSVSAYLFNFVITLVSSVYLLLEMRVIVAFMERLIRVFVPRKSTEILFKYLGETNQYFKKFLYCTLIDGFIIGLASVAGLRVIGTRYWVVLGIIEGALNMIPYFGAIVGSVIVVVIVLLTDGAGKALIACLFLFILQQIDGNIIKVKLYGDSFQISPFLVLFSITIGGALYGVLGMVIAIPVVAVLKSILDDAIEYKLKKNAEKGW